MAKRKAPTPKWPAAEVERRTLDQLISYVQNPRRHSEEQVQKIAASMLKFGWTVPCLIDGGGELIAGHGRCLAAQTLVDQGHARFNDVPVMIARGWSESQKRAYRIADNQLALTSEWDMAALKLELTDLKLDDFDLTVLGFHDSALEWMTSGEIVTDPDGEWTGMPGFHQEDATAFRSLIVHFKGQAEFDDFCRLIGQTLGEKAKFTWFPSIEIKRFIKWGSEDGSPAAVSDLHNQQGPVEDTVHVEGPRADEGPLPDSSGGAGARLLRGRDRSGQDHRPGS